MDFSGFSFDPSAVLALYAGSWLLGTFAGGLAAIAFSVVSRRGGG